MKIANFVGGSCPEFSPNAAAERTKNLFPHRIEGGLGKNRAVLHRVPGLRLFSGLTGTSTRGAYEINGRAFVVGGDTVYEVGSAGTTTVRGTVIDDGLPVSFASNGDNGNQLMLTSGGSGYICALDTNTFTHITDPNFATFAVMCGFVDGYFVALDRDTSVWQISALYDGLTWDGLDTAQVSQAADKVKAFVVDNRQIWLFGRATTSVWYNSGNPSFPFEPIQQQIAQGIVAPHTAKRADNSVLWLGRNELGAGVLYRADQYLPRRVSTHAIEQIWATYDTIEDAEAYVEQWMGHVFYHLYVPSALTAPDQENRVTWTYDIATGLWHERCLLDQATGHWTPDIGRCHMYAFEKHLIGDRRIGALYEARQDVFDDELVAA